jgi:hypothetical protein
LIRPSLVRPTLVGLFAAGLLACGTVLGLGDYEDQPGDGGFDASTDSRLIGSGDVGTQRTGDTGGDEAVDGTEVDSAGEAAPDAEGDDGPALDAIALDATGDAGPDAASDAATDAAQDASTDAGADAFADGSSPPDASAPDGSFVVPIGWSVVAFAGSPEAGCPSGFAANPVGVVFGVETPAAGACSCDSCSVSTPPSCVVGEIAGEYDLNGSRTCGTVSQPLANAMSGGCNTDNPHGRIYTSDVEWTPPGPTNGACNAAPPTAHPNQVAFGGQGLACSPEADAGNGCYDGGVCSPALSAPFMLCVAQPGDVACPATSFTVAYHVGTGASLSCSGTCGCAVGATCTNGTVTYYRDTECTNPMTFVMAANGACNPANGGGNTFGSYVYSATVEGVTCSVSGTPTAIDVGLTGEETICCVP